MTLQLGQPLMTSAFKYKFNENDRGQKLLHFARELGIGHDSTTVEDRCSAWMKLELKGNSSSDVLNFEFQKHQLSFTSES